MFLNVAVGVNGHNGSLIDKHWDERNIVEILLVKYGEIMMFSHHDVCGMKVIHNL